MDPSQLVDNVVQGLAINGEFGASITELWNLATKSMGLVADQTIDDVAKAALWRWISQDERVLFTRKGTLIVERGSLENMIQYHDLHLFASEDEQWLTLTGRPKSGNSLGALPFQVLSAVSRAGPRGLTVVEINRETGQDARSLFGRVQKLIDHGLVTRFPVLKDGSHTNLVVSRRFLKQRDHDEKNRRDSQANFDEELSQPPLDKTQLAEAIVSIAKSGPNGICLLEQVYTKGGFAKFRRGSPLLRRMLSRLESMGVLRRVDVFEPADPDVRYKCVQYIRDLPHTAHMAEDGAKNSDILTAGEDEEFDVEEEDDEDESGIVSRMDSSLMLGSENTEDQCGLNLENVQITPSEFKAVLANLYYPLEAQVYDFISSRTTRGLPAMELYSGLTGQHYSKTFGRLLESLVHKGQPTKVRSPANLGYMAIVGGIDFVARMKFYRYFTQPHYYWFKKLPPNLTWGEFSPRKKIKNISLHDLHEKLSTGLNGYVAVIQTSTSSEQPLFHGDRTEQVSKVLRCSEAEAPRRRGRPPKNPQARLKSKQSQIHDKLGSMLDVSLQEWTGGESSTEVSLAGSLREPMDALVKSEGNAAAFPPGRSSRVEISSSHPTVEHDGISFAGQRRDNLLMQLLRESSGAMEGGSELMRRMSRLQNEGATIDRKTLNSTVRRLVGMGLLKQILVSTPGARGPPVVRYVLYDPSLNEADERVLAVKSQLVATTARPRPPESLTAARTTDEVDRSALSELFQQLPKPRRFHALSGKTRQAENAEKRRFGPSAAEVTGHTTSTLTLGTRGRPRLTEEEKKKAVTEKLESRKMRNGVRPPSKRENNPDTDAGLLSPRDMDTLFRAVIVSRSLSGKGATIDWDLVASLVPGLSSARARRRWPAVRDVFGGTKAMKHAKEQWEKTFLQAYTNAEIEYHEPGSDTFSLKAYVDLWQRKQGSLGAITSESHHHVDICRVRGITRTIPPKNVLEAAYTLPSMVKTDELMANTPFADHSGDFEFSAQFTAEESLVRSVVAADDAEYSEADAAAILSELGENVVKEAVDMLSSKRLIAYVPRDATKVQPGRNYTFTEKFQTSLATRMDLDFVKQASEYRAELANAGRLVLPTTLNDAHMVAILELVSQGRIQLQGKVNTGNLLTDYRSRMIDKEKLDFEIEISVDEATSPETPELPIPLSKDTPYVWQIGNRVTGRAVWLKLLDRLLQLIASRPHITSELLVASLQPGFSRFEVTAAVTWLVEIGAVQNDKGFRAQPQWYARVGDLASC